ncbi:hypothetical protein STAFG_4562 [Streptomyces afghaniensis 772]|uniref:Uncharacterized protein n=1 Tax=Streptomyces afghaniensis 772 TaxID=1283301 RepID=S4NJ32_9ACTN|nr:hypothetical protein STAFG_4562 [Streptomyces afghaniensis 772]
MLVYAPVVGSSSKVSAPFPVDLDLTGIKPRRKSGE